MNNFPRYFIFGKEYRAGDDYVRCEGRGKSTVVAPGVGEVPAGDELVLERCMNFVSRGVTREAERNEIRQKAGRD